MRVSFPERGAVLESSASDIVRLSRVFGRPAEEMELEALNPGRATLRARVDGEIVDEVALEVLAPDEVWWAIGTVPLSRGRGEFALVEGESVALWATCAAEGRALIGFPPDLAWVAGGASFSSDGYEVPQFERAGGAIPRGDHATMFTSSSWTLAGPRVEVVGAEDVTVGFAIDDFPRHRALVRLVLTRADGSVVEGGRISTPIGLGLPSANLSPPGYYFRRDPAGATTFTFLLGETEHSVQVEGHASIVQEGSGGGIGSCSAASASPPDDATIPWCTLLLAALALLCGRRVTCF